VRPDVTLALRTLASIRSAGVAGSHAAATAGHGAEAGAASEGSGAQCWLAG